MNCQHIEQNIDDYLEGALANGQIEAFDAHLKNCLACRTRLVEAQQLQASLKSLSVPMMSEGFAQRALTRAAGEPKKQGHRGAFVAGFGSAMVAGFALMLVVVGLLPNDDSLDEGLVEVAISLEIPQTVNLAFDLAQAMEGATLSIVLPANVEVVGYPGLTRLTWQADLHAGRNVLPLPLMGVALAQGELLASIELDGKKKMIRLKINVGQQPMSQVNQHKIKVV